MERFGRYELIKKIATGGMAEIFLARQAGIEGFEKLLVLKRILPHLAENEEFVEMFLHEAKIAVRLTHPNIAQIFDLGEENGTYFIAMEYVHGNDVRRIWKACEKAGIAPPIPLACRIAIDSSAGLYHAHTKTDGKGQPLNIIHRDISPQNILISYEGAVKVTDFGIAKASDQSNETQAGVLKGKYSYMSPEQASGLPLDHRSDQFALGIVLYELLTFQRLFKRGNDIQTLAAVIDDEVPPPSTLNPNIPPELDAIVMRCLQKDRDARYPDMQAFQIDLENWLMATRQQSSGALLSNFLKSLYADRLAQEAQEELPAMEADFADASESVVSKRVQRRRSSLISVPARSSIAPRNSDGVSRITRSPSRVRQSPLDESLLDPSDTSNPSNATKSVRSRRNKTSEHTSTSTASKRRRPTNDDLAMAPQKSNVLGTIIKAIIVLILLALLGGGAFYLHTTTEGGLTGLISGLQPPKVDLVPPALPNLPKPAASDESETIRLTINSVPSGADVYYNDSLLGQTPVTQNVPRAESASIRVSSPGYIDRSDKIVLGGTNTFTFKLVKKSEPAVATPSETMPPPTPAKPERHAKRPRADRGTKLTDSDAGTAKKHAVATSTSKAEESAQQAPAEKAEEPQQKGIVHVVSSPSAKVFEGNVELCAKTPCSFKLVPGKHRIVLKYLEGGCETPRVFTLKSGQELSFDILQSRGQLLVMAQPWADVWLDGKKLGTTPFPKVNLCEGKYRLLLVNADLNKKKQVEISIAANELTKVNVNMEAP